MAEHAPPLFTFRQPNSGKHIAHNLAVSRSSIPSIDRCFIEEKIHRDINPR
jgi:hypothetical protein